MGLSLLRQGSWPQSKVRFTFHYLRLHGVCCKNCCKYPTEVLFRNHLAIVNECIERSFDIFVAGFS